MATHLIIFFFCQFWILPYTHVLAGFQACPLQAETSTQTPSAPSLVDIINAVKNLRFRHGLTPLTVHDVLMDVAAEQAKRDWASASRPLGQELILKGFPLWGDLLQYGFAPRMGCRYDCLRSHLNVVGR